MNFDEIWWNEMEWITAIEFSANEFIIITVSLLKTIMRWSEIIAEINRNGGQFSLINPQINLIKLNSISFPVMKFQSVY